MSKKKIKVSKKALAAFNAKKAIKQIDQTCKALGMSEDVYMSGKGRTGSKYQEAAPRAMTAKEAADTVLSTGTYKGSTLREVYNQDKRYLKDLMANPETPGQVREAITTMLMAANGSK